LLTWLSGDGTRLVSGLHKHRRFDSCR